MKAFHCVVQIEGKTVLYQLHVGHSRAAQALTFKGDDPPVCIHCDVDELLTVEHVLSHSLDPIRLI